MSSITEKKERGSPAGLSRIGGKLIDQEEVAAKALNREGIALAIGEAALKRK